ncbi:hypothetical protein ColLi_10927 [Colletotrichum liriopes]|uniref:Uncharacterized protein n=1 Tax=Colletotrichum liriopes TaxID=708192 RepID=A0AA37LXA6_9PEZI|nr:hypothetical protein ColLi_10927 [Colletotrichum liriopes]
MCLVDGFAVAPYFCHENFHELHQPILFHVHVLQRDKIRVVEIVINGFLSEAEEIADIDIFFWRLDVELARE